MSFVGPTAVTSLVSIGSCRRSQWKGPMRWYDALATEEVECGVGVVGHDLLDHACTEGHGDVVTAWLDEASLDARAEGQLGNCGEWLRKRPSVGAKPGVHSEWLCGYRMVSSCGGSSRDEGLFQHAPG